MAVKSSNAFAILYSWASFLARHGRLQLESGGSVDSRKAAADLYSLAQEKYQLLLELAPEQPRAPALDCLLRRARLLTSLALQGGNNGSGSPGGNGNGTGEDSNPHPEEYLLGSNRCVGAKQVLDAAVQIAMPAKERWSRDVLRDLKETRASFWAQVLKEVQALAGRFSSSQDSLTANALWCWQEQLSSADESVLAGVQKPEPWLQERWACLLLTLLLLSSCFSYSDVFLGS